jgi:hypothetical protein
LTNPFFCIPSAAPIKKKGIGKRQGIEEKNKFQADVPT